MTTPNQDVSQIRGVLQAFTDALHRRDAAAAVAVYADDAVAYDLAPPSSVEGERLRDPAGIQSWFDTWKSPIESTAKELTIRVGGDIAYAFTLQRMVGTKTDGYEVDLWFRATACFVRRMSSEDRARSQLGAVRDGRQLSRAARSEALIAQDRADTRAR